MSNQYYLVLPDDFTLPTNAAKVPLSTSCFLARVDGAKPKNLPALDAGDYVCAELGDFDGFTSTANSFDVRRLSSFVSSTSTSAGAVTATITLNADNEDIVIKTMAGTNSGTGAYGAPTLDFGSGPVAPDSTEYSEAVAISGGNQLAYVHRWNARTAVTADFSIAPTTGDKRGVFASVYVGSGFDVVVQAIGSGGSANLTSGVSGDLNVLAGDYLAATMNLQSYDGSGASWTGITFVSETTAVRIFSLAEDTNVASTASPRAISFATTSDTSVNYIGAVLRFTPAA